MTDQVSWLTKSCMVVKHVALHGLNETALRALEYSVLMGTSTDWWHWHRGTWDKQ